MRRIILLDIDGVLVQPRGYRSALRAVLDYFASLMGLSPFDLTETSLHQLEARGISSEWDMLPLLLAAIWQEILSGQEAVDLPADVKEAAIAMGRLRVRSEEVIPAIPVFPLLPDCYPAESALSAGLFPAIPLPLRENLLLHTRDPFRSATTRLFQQYVLGSALYRRIYRQENEVESDSYLQRYDRPLLPPPVQKQLCALSQQEETSLAAMTARPCLPPRGIDGEVYGYAPEAEIALRMVGLPEVTLIGFGKLKYVGELYGIEAEMLLKPSPVHALAAVGAVLSGDELWASRAAVEWLLRGGREIFHRLPPEIEIHVVEDTLGGIRSAWGAAEVLKQEGKIVRVFSWGMTGNQAEKTQALTEKGIPCYGDWESLLSKTRNFRVSQGEG